MRLHPPARLMVRDRPRESDYAARCAPYRSTAPIKASPSSGFGRNSRIPAARARAPWLSLHRRETLAEAAAALTPNTVCVRPRRHNRWHGTTASIASRSSSSSSTRRTRCAWSVLVGGASGTYNLATARKWVAAVSVRTRRCWTMETRTHNDRSRPRHARVAAEPTMCAARSIARPPQAPHQRQRASARTR